MQTHKRMPQKRLFAWEICSVVSMSGSLARKRTTGRKKDQIDLQHRPHFENRKMVLFKCLVWMSSRVNRAKRFTHTRLSELCGRKWTLGRASLLQALRDWLCEAIYMSGKHTLMHKTTSGVSISGATRRTWFMPVCEKTERVNGKNENKNSCTLRTSIHFLFDLPPKTEKLHPQREREAL